MGRRGDCGAAFRAVLLVLFLFVLSQAAWMAAAGDAFAQSAEDIARRNIAAFRSTFDPQAIKAAGLTQAQAEQMRKIYAFQISNDYTARRLLKTAEFTDLGREYYKMWFQEGDGLIRQVIGRAKGKMSGYSSEVLDLVEIIQNEASRTAMKAPMDFDVGIITRSREQAREVLKKLGGPGGVAKFHRDFQKALEEAYIELFESLGGTKGSINAARSFISATTGWHPEAYADVKVLKQGGVASKDLVQQTVDVSKYKVAEMRKHVEHGALTLDEAMEEAARGTAKDLAKVESVFNHIEKITGVKPKWSAEQAEMILVLKKVEKMEMSAAEANDAIRRISGGRLDLFGACDNLMDQMESAWRLRPKKPQEMLLNIFAEFLDDADYDKSFKALLEGSADDFPAGAKKLISELDVMGKARLLSIRGGTASQFMEEFAKDFPAYKICTKTGDASVQEFVKFMESGAKGEDAVAIFGREQTERLRKVHELMKPEIKAKIQARYGTNKFAIWELDQKGRVLLGDPGVATLGIDAGVGLAMAFWQTSTIMGQNLSPDEESRQILNAWGTSLPVVGDIAQGIIEGIEAYYGDDKTKYFKAGAWLAIGAAGLVPGAQAPAMVIGLTLATYEVSSSMFDISKDKTLLEAWLASGEFDKESGKLQKLYDSKGGAHELSFEGIITGGGVPYKEVLTETTIRESVYLYAERNGLDQLEKLQSYIRALKVPYPDFPFKETLREPVTAAKPLFAAVIREGGAKEPFKTVEMLMFVKAKQIVDAEVNRACQGIVAQVEAEYQARNFTGDAFKVYSELEALGKRLGLPLIQNVNDIFKSFSTFVVEGVKTPWVRESLPRRRVMLMEKYLNGYLEIEKSLKTIKGVFERAGIRPPGFNLSGFLEVDAPRIKDLEAAYLNRAIGESGKDVQAIHRELSGDNTYVFNVNQPDPCDAELFKQLAGIKVRIVEAEDRKLLLEQWTGKKSAAEASRDASLRKAQDATKGMKTGSWVTIPSAVWDSLCENYEAAYAWGNVRWEGSQVYEDAIAGQKERIDKLAKEYADAREKGKEPMATCLAQAPQGSIQVSNPSPDEGDTVSAKIALTGAKPPKGAQWKWQATGGLELGSTAGEQVSLTARSSGTVSASLVLGAKTLGTLQASVTVKPKDKKEDKKDGEGAVTPGSGDVKFSATAPGNWEGGNTKEGFVLTRKPAKIKGPCGWDSSVTGSLKAKFYAYNKNAKSDPKSPADCTARAEQSFKARRQGDTPNDMAVGLFMGGGIEGVSGMSMGDYAGSIADFAIWIRRGSGGMFGYTGSYMGANGRGCAFKEGTGFIEFSYNAWGGGCWDNSDRAYLVSQTASAQEEAKAILASLRVDPSGQLKTEPYKGPKYDGSDLPKVTLSPPSLDKLRVGDTVKVTAEVHNDKPEDSPFTYNWGGTFDGKAEDAKKNATITIKPQKPGKYDLSVSVDGKRFGMGGASLQYEVADYRVKVERAPADTKPVPVSVKTGFKATLTVDGKPAGGTFIYRWQPHPEISFDKLDSNVPDVNAAFPKPGRVKVWVQVLERREGREATVAESEQLEIEVIKPQLELAFEPKEPWVGQELKAKLTVKPEVKEIDFRWMPVPDNAKQSLESKDGKEITFYLKDDKPAEIKVLARVPKSGEDLGEAKNTIKAKKYAVNVTGPKAMGPKPKVWKEGVGLVDVEKGIAVDQVVEFAADTQPAALTGPVKYQWTVSSGSCTVSNPTSREARATASAAGGCELSVVIRDKNDVHLGEGKGSFDATITRETIKQGQDKAKDVSDAKTKVTDAKNKARKGDYDGAIKDAEDAAKLDPSNKEAATTAQKLRQEKETIHQQIEKAKKLMDENKFADAQKELIVASNLNSYYPPVPAANQELGDRWRKYNDEVRDKVYEVRSANEKKEFGKALEIASAWRASTKLDPYADEQLRQQENWAKQWKAQKDRQIGVLKEAGEKVKNYDYAGALKLYDEGFANGQNIYNGSEPEYKEAVELRSQAFTKNKRLGELIPWVRKAAEDKEYLTVDALQNTLKTADEAIALQPNNEQLKTWRAMIVARAEKTKEDNERTAAGRKYLDTARSEENTYLSQVSYVQSKSGQWGENVEVDMQSHIQKAIDNYRESLRYIPDAAVEKKIRELEATLESRKKYLENYRLSVTLKNEADALYRQATQDPDIVSASPKYDEAAEKYRKSLSLYRPFNAETIEKTIFVLETYKHERWVKKYWADGQALEKENKIVEAVAAYDKAIASFHPTVPQMDRMWIISHAQDLRNRITGAKNWRADGEAKQKAGKIPEAIASYRQSLKLLPDAALEEHVRMLEGRQAEAGEKKATADKLWQEGTALFNQGRPSDALTKFKESLGYWSDASRQKYVADLEARRAKAVALRDEGSKLQNQNRIAEAVAKYKESLTYWPDPGLTSHIATLEGKVKQDADAAARKARAKQLRDEGYALQQKNQLQAAVGKYKESLAVWPDKQLEDYIRQLEAKIAAVPPVVTPPVTPPAAKSFDGTYSGTVSGASTGTVQFTVSGTSVTGTVSGKYGQDAYRATLSGTLNRSTGDLTTKLAGDVTGTPFQGGLNGRIQGNSASGDWHARNQYGNPTGTWQASRGGSVRAEPTAAEIAAGNAAINIIGRWKTETIEGGKVDAVSYSMFNRDGSYTMDVSGEELAGLAVCTIRGSYTLSGQTLTLRPSGSQCKFRDGTTRSEPVERFDTVTGRVSGNDRSFTYLPGGNVSVRYTRQ